jgi:hypothetical protein
MGKQHHSSKTSQGPKGEDEGRDSDRNPKFGKSTDNRRDPGRKEEGRFTDDRPSEGHGSNFGDDEIGGTSFDSRPAPSEEKRRKVGNVKKKGTTP